VFHAVGGGPLLKCGCCPTIKTSHQRRHRCSTTGSVMNAVKTLTSTHTRTQARTHARIHTCLHARTHARTHAHSLAGPHARTHARPCAHTLCGHAANVKDERETGRDTLCNALCKALLVMMSIRHRAADDDRARLRHADPPRAPRTLPLLPPLPPLSQARRTHHADTHHAANRIARRKAIEDSRSQRQAEGFTRRHAGLEARRETRCGVGLRQRGNSGQHPASRGHLRHATGGGSRSARMMLLKKWAGNGNGQR
jgi:hypothetical protein